MIFCVFIATQEYGDQSHLSTILLTAKYSRRSITQGFIMAQILTNIAVSFFGTLLGKCTRKKEGQLMLIFVLYFIITFELLRHVLPMVLVYFSMNQYN